MFEEQSYHECDVYTVCASGERAEGSFPVLNIKQQSGGEQALVIFVSQGKHKSTYLSSNKK